MALSTFDHHNYSQSIITTLQEVIHIHICIVMMKYKNPKHVANSFMSYKTIFDMRKIFNQKKRCAPKQQLVSFLDTQVWFDIPNRDRVQKVSSILFCCQSKINTKSEDISNLDSWTKEKSLLIISSRSRSRWNEICFIDVSHERSTGIVNLFERKQIHPYSKVMSE